MDTSGGSLIILIIVFLVFGWILIPIIFGVATVLAVIHMIKGEPVI
jgi:hypothetical protein